jgi:hypothetical protein
MICDRVTHGVTWNMVLLRAVAKTLNHGFVVDIKDLEVLRTAKRYFCPISKRLYLIRQVCWISVNVRVFHDPYTHKTLYTSLFPVFGRLTSQIILMIMWTLLSCCDSRTSLLL